MKAKPTSTSNSDPPDDWVNGSWTVDCICGVNFDDGEEMVNCDVCGVWVHTRCSRFVRGHKSFACDKCKLTLNSSSITPSFTPKVNTNTEETEVAQLLVELPTKTIKLTTPLDSRHPHRLWTDRPIHQRVHSQGVPGGDPSVFRGVSSVFTSQLWKCTGYIPKKFNFSFREFPCWDDDENRPTKVVDEADNGAGVLYSLSKETLLPPSGPRTQLKPASSEKKSPKDGKLVGFGSKDGREKVGPVVIHSGKRSREHLLNSKDRNGKKKSKVIHVENEGKREKVHASKTDAIRSIQGEVRNVKALNEKHGSEKEASLQETVTNTKTESGKTDKSKAVPAPDEGNVALCSADERVKEEKHSKDEPERVRKSTKTDVAPLPSVEDDATENSFMKKEGLVTSDVIINQGALPDPLVSKPSVEELTDASLERKDIRAQKNLETKSLSRSPYRSSKNLDNLKAVLRRRVLDVANLDGMKDLNEKTFPVKHGLGAVQENVNVTSPPNCQTSEYESDKGMEDERIGETTGNPCNSKLEDECSENLVELPKIQTESNGIPSDVGDVSTKMESISQSQPTTLVGKSSSTSSTIVISRSSISDKNRSTHSQNPNPASTSKRMISTTKKDSTPVDPVKDKDDDRRGKTKFTVKDNQKSSLNPIMKASQPSQASTSPVLKQSTLAGKDSSRYHPSSKSASVESSVAPSGVGESAASSETRHSLSVQSKDAAPGGPHRGEKVSQSSKLAQSSNSPAGLSDEELALLLHQELNSSPRVPRVPRVRHAGSLPQLSSVAPSSLLIKRTSSSGGKDQHMISRRKSKDARSSREQSNETRKADRVPSSPDSGKISEANCELLNSGENNAESVSPSAANSGPSSYSASEQNPSSSQGLREDDTGTNKGVTPSHRTLPGLLAEIMSKGKRMTYEELCNAVLPHWQSLRKHNGERYAYSSHSQAVLDCLRNRSEWARLVDRGPKTNGSRKRRKIDAEPSNMESEDGEDRISKDDERKNMEANKEEFPKRRRNARKRRKVTVQGRSMKDERRKRRKMVGTVSDESSSSSESREGSGSSEDESQESGMYSSKSEVSGSTDG